jgi:penicillin-binding protein 1A
LLARAHRRVFTGLIAAIAVLLWGTIGAAAWFVGSIVTGLPDEAALRGIGTMARATTLYDVNDRQAFTIFKEQRIEVPLERVSPHLIRALLAIEDQRFYDHGGIDVIRVAGAAWSNLRNGWGSQGASTITQQLARQSFLTREKTLQRKLREVVVAARLEGEFSKDEILQFYVNKVYFGDGLHGVEAASLGYFGKHAADLSVAEAALLAGLVKSPSTTAPTVSPERAVTRRNAVLQAMLESASIDRATYDQAVATEVELNDVLRREEAYGQYFKEEVRKQLVQEFGWERVYEGGLKVYTTLDLDMQKVAEAQIARTLADIERRQSSRRRAAAVAADALQAALVAMDPHTGEVRAMVGGRSFDESHFNRVTQARRQAGSAFKPFVYAAALERGYTPASVIRALDTPIMTLQGAWVPDDHSTSSAMTMRAALRSSSNRIAVQTLQEIGVSAAVDSAERLGITGMPAVPSLALGSGDVTLMNMTAAYAAFANAGMRPMPTLIRRVETADGVVLFNAVPRAERAVSEATAFLMTSMLADVVNSGTAWQARQVGFRLPAAGKTGTTNDYKDAWFVGYTPTLATGVWVGYDQPRTIIGNGYAGDLAVPLWGRFMAAATRDHDHETFKPPSTVRTATICRLTGKLATSDCHGAVDFDEDGEPTGRSAVYTEYFVRGTEPTTYCDHRSAFFGTFAGRRLSLPAPAGVPVLMQVPAGGSTPTTSANAELPAAVASGDAKAPGEPVAQPDTQRRGFWSRLFGIGGRRQAPARPEPAAEAAPPDAPANAR